MKKIVLLVFCGFLSICGKAQISTPSFWEFGVFADNLAHPGFKVGYQTPFRDWVKVRQKKKGEITKYKSLYYGGDVGYYRHPKNHHGITISPNVSYLRIKENGKFFHLKLDLGYHRSIVDGKVYTVNDEGAFDRKSGYGQNTFYNSLSFSFGKSLDVTKNIPLRYFWGFGLSGRYPFNHFYLPAFRLNFGVQYLLKSKN